MEFVLERHFATGSSSAQIPIFRSLDIWRCGCFDTALAPARISEASGSYQVLRGVIPYIRTLRRVELVENARGMMNCKILSVRTATARANSSQDGMDLIQRVSREHQ